MKVSRVISVICMILLAVNIVNAATGVLEIDMDSMEIKDWDEYDNDCSSSQDEVMEDDDGVSDDKIVIHAANIGSLRGKYIYRIEYSAYFEDVMDSSSIDDGDLEIEAARENGRSGCDGCMDWDDARSDNCIDDYDTEFWDQNDIDDREYDDVWFKVAFTKNGCSYLSDSEVRSDEFSYGCDEVIGLANDITSSSDLKWFYVKYIANTDSDDYAEADIRGEGDSNDYPRIKFYWADCNIDDPCCTSSGNFASSSTVCQSNIANDYSCRGTSDVWKRTQDRYCSGSSSGCDGGTAWGSWNIADDCTSDEYCEEGHSSCTSCGYHTDYKCYGGDVYWYDECDNREDKKEDCPNGCSGNVCIACSPHDRYQCYAGDVWWYDSCNAREDKKEECGGDYCDSWSLPYCKNDDTYQSRTCYDKGCSGTSCYTNTRTEERMDMECGEDVCEDWEANYCKNGDVYHNRTCNRKGCLSGGCFNYEEPEEEIVQECTFGCSGGSCEGECVDDSDCSGNYMCVGNMCELKKTSDLAMSIDAYPVWNHDGYFVGTETVHFETELTNALSDCVPDAEGYCTIPLTLDSSSKGTAVLDNLYIYYNDSNIVVNNTPDIYSIDGIDVSEDIIVNVEAGDITEIDIVSNIANLTSGRYESNDSLVFFSGERMFIDANGIDFPGCEAYNTTSFEMFEFEEPVYSESGVITNIDDPVGMYGTQGNYDCSYSGTDWCYGYEYDSGYITAEVEIAGKWINEIGKSCKING
ncbi:hypothetical protein GF361_03730, partial [Candidatus Woesearchaeota archaeon]|nr:hypothetical protein [Candidatus Woesearchaeota archaeon]